jgi:hypothetical protein
VAPGRRSCQLELENPCLDVTVIASPSKPCEESRSRWLIGRCASSSEAQGLEEVGSELGEMSWPVGSALSTCKVEK